MHTPRHEPNTLRNTSATFTRTVRNLTAATALAIAGLTAGCSRTPTIKPIILPSGGIVPQQPLPPAGESPLPESFPFIKNDRRNDEAPLAQSHSYLRKDYRDDEIFQNPDTKQHETGRERRERETYEETILFHDPNLLPGQLTQHQHRVLANQDKAFFDEVMNRKSEDTPFAKMLRDIKPEEVESK